MTDPLHTNELNEPGEQEPLSPQLRSLIHDRPLPAPSRESSQFILDTARQASTGRQRTGEATATVHPNHAWARSWRLVGWSSAAAACIVLAAALCLSNGRSMEQTKSQGKHGPQQMAAETTEAPRAEAMAIDNLDQVDDRIARTRQRMSRIGVARRRLIVDRPLPPLDKRLGNLRAVSQRLRKAMEVDLPGSSRRYNGLNNPPTIREV